MSACTGSSLIEHLKKVPDPRVKRSRRHELMDILVIALCATIAGADDWVEVVQFAQAKKASFATFLQLPNGIASHDTFKRVFQILDSKILERVCIDWLQGIAGKVQCVVAIDDKILRGSPRDGDNSPLHIVSAWACANSMLLGQVQTDKKSNEITAIPTLLELLNIEGCVNHDRCHEVQEIHHQRHHCSPSRLRTDPQIEPPLPAHHQVDSWFKKCQVTDCRARRRFTPLG